MKDLIVFVTQNDDTFNNPVLNSIFYELEKTDRDCLVLCSKNVFPGSYSRVKVLRLLPTTRPRRDFFLNILIKIIQYLVFAFYYRNVKTIIGIDPRGIIEADSLRKRNFKKVPLDYFSFELYYQEHFNKKNKEIDACKNIRYLIIQDKLREEELRKINFMAGIGETIFMPVSYSVRLNVSAKKNDFREQYNISADKKLLIFLGTLEDWTGGDMCADILEKKLLPENYILVIHSRFPLSNTRPVHKRLLAIAESNDQIIISNNYIPKFEDVISFLSQFDFGLVIYLPVIRDFNALLIGKNILHIGLSSGKFSMMMQAGLPVLAYEIPTYKALMSRNKIGFTFKNIEELTSILKSDSLTNMRDECLNFYNKKLDNTQTVRQYLQYC